MKMREVILRAIAREITWDQAADILGMTYSAMNRLRTLYRTRGYDGLWARGRGKRAMSCIRLSTVEEILRLYRANYRGMNVREFREKLMKRHCIDLRREWLSKILAEAGLGSPAGRHTRRSA
jgi:hypothetical protein